MNPDRIEEIKNYLRNLQPGEITKAAQIACELLAEVDRLTQMVVAGNERMEKVIQTIGRAMQPKKP